MKKHIASLAAIGMTFSLTAQAWAPMDSIEKLESNSKQLKTLRKNIKGDVMGEMGDGSEPENWFNLSPVKDAVEGVGTEEAYNIFGAPKEEVIVAVIDSGVDVNHEDLQGKVWTNPGEIADNGIDDDGNGYIDDVFGWNFIGNEKGMASIRPSNALNGYTLVKGDPSLQVDADTLEMTREVVRLKKLESELTSIGYHLSPEEKKLLIKLTAEVEENRKKAQGNYGYVKQLLANYNAFVSVLKTAGLKEVSVEAVNAIVTTTDEQAKAKEGLLDYLARGDDEATLKDYYGYYEAGALYHYNTDSDTRAEIVKDDYANNDEKVYGNNDVIGPDSSHGTHVSGIIAAARDNGIGMNGVASNVKIMAVRCVPNGDERDKDVANSIYYAVDNGAKIINMSFGKAYSPYKGIVDKAVKYAESKGVLLVHAAGNSAQDNDTASNFPNDKVGSKTAKNWVEVGASAYMKGPSLAADFSNFGKVNVDVFAPGKNIHATFPDNSYSTISGTSMASPVVAGVAAAILGHFPEMKAQDLKEALSATTTRYPALMVNKRGVGSVYFSALSVTGGVVNLYSALAVLNDEVQVPFMRLASN